MALMKTYLSFGGGVNSVAMMLLMLDEGWEFEAVFVDHGCDWPETYSYLEMLLDKGYKITILKPNVEGESNLYKFCWDREIIPSRMLRWCTDKFKLRTLHAYMEKPCFCCLGFDVDEAHRATIFNWKGQENRFPLIEKNITRRDCMDFIQICGLPLPVKSGCWFCPYQGVKDYRRLRMNYPDLYCQAKALEDRAVEKRLKENKTPYYLQGKPLEILVNEAQGELFEEYKPPCYCGR